MPQFDVAVVGAGIVGLAHAYAAAKRGRRVIVYERDRRAQGASIRNFGLIWPIGQPTGARLRMALRSREIWREVLDAARLAYFATGSLHLAYREDEAAVAQEFARRAAEYDCAWLDAAEVLRLSPAANPQGLLGGLWSATEMTVHPPAVIRELPAFLAERFGVAFRYGETVTNPANLAARTVVASGDVDLLYPELLRAQPIRRCKLQMMRTAPQPAGWVFGPALAGGLTLRFYPSFRVCESLEALAARIAREMPEYDRWGIHVLASATPRGEITLGDSHEYDLETEAFDKPEIDELILRYLRTFALLPNPNIAERWHGVYTKHSELPWFVADPEPGVRVVTALGGAGMTLSFGLAEKNMEEIL
jgi:FAD dependent oxidoreductase TIGR03364